MKAIGEKIKEYRLINNMTQEQLASYLNVTFQTVSKWETGISSPDLSLIIPITKLFRISADELLGINDVELDKRYDELDMAYKHAVKTGDFAERQRICELAVSEYPGDMKWLLKFALSIAHCDVEYEECADNYLLEIEKAIKILDTIIKNCKDEVTKQFAIHRIIQLLSYIGHRDRAKKYAEMLPISSPPTKDTVMEYILDGDELLKYNEEKLLTHVLRIFWELQKMPTAYTDLYRNIVKVVFPDGNYLGINSGLYYAAKREIQHILQHNPNVSTEKILELLCEMKSYAKAYDEIVFSNPEVYKYTAPWFAHIELDTRGWRENNDTSLTQEFYEYLELSQFDYVRKNDCFETLKK